MRKLFVGVVIVIALFIVVLTITSKAEAHKPDYCGHADKYWVVYDSSGHYTRYGMFNTGGWGAGPHYHEYKVYREAWSSTRGYYWVFVHTHTRTCNTWV